MLQTLQLEVLDLKGNFKNNQQLLLIITYLYALGPARTGKDSEVPQ